MHLTIAQARRLNIAPEIIDRARRRADGPAVADHPVGITGMIDDGMNGLERRFAGTLKLAVERRLVRQWMREPFRLRLAGGVTYRPDFLVWPEPTSDWRVTFVEVKGGFFRDDAKVKTKVVADRFPMFRWLLVTGGGADGWEVREVDAMGIHRKPIIVPWING